VEPTLLQPVEEIVDLEQFVKSQEFIQRQTPVSEKDEEEK